MTFYDSMGYLQNNNRLQARIQDCIHAHTYNKTRCCINFFLLLTCYIFLAGIYLVPAD